MQVRQQRFDGIENEAQIRLAVFVERGRDTENKRVDFGCAGKIGGGVKATPDSCLDARRWNMLDVGFPCMESVNLGLIYIEADDFITDFAIAKHKRETDVAEPHNSYRCRLAVELVD